MPILVNRRIGFFSPPRTRRNIAAINFNVNREPVVALSAQSSRDNIPVRNDGTKKNVQKKTKTKCFRGIKSGAIQGPNPLTSRNEMSLEYLSRLQNCGRDRIHSSLSPRQCSKTWREPTTWRIKLIVRELANQREWERCNIAVGW